MPRRHLRRWPTLNSGRIDGVFCDYSSVESHRCFLRSSASITVLPPDIACIRAGGPLIDLDEHFKIMMNVRSVEKSLPRAKMAEVPLIEELKAR